MATSVRQERYALPYALPYALRELSQNYPLCRLTAHLRRVLVHFVTGPILMKFDCGGRLEKMSIIGEGSTVKI